MSEQMKESLLSKASVAAILGLLTWNIYTTQQLTVNLAVLNEKVSQIEKSLNQ